MNRSRVLTSAVVVMASVLMAPVVGGSAAFASGSVGADSPPADQMRESVLVSGTGAVSGTPDTLSVDFGVETSGKTVAEALSSANVAAGRMRDALVRGGVARADLQTSNLSVGTKVNNDQAVVGYTVSEGLTAKIRSVPRAGDLMSAAIAAGGDAARLNGVSFTIENDAKLLNEARKKAFADARQKAELYAGEAGRPLGRVLTIAEATPSSGGPVMHFSPIAMDSRFPIEPGQQQLTVTVTVEWALDQAPQPASPATTRRSA